jgi:hypothetical protein
MADEESWLESVYGEAQWTDFSEHTPLLAPFWFILIVITPVITNFWMTTGRPPPLVVLSNACRDREV